MSKEDNVESLQPAAVRVQRDERGERTQFEEIEVGKDLGTLEWALTPEQIALEMEIYEDYHPWYHVDSPYGGPIAPLMVTYSTPRKIFSRTYHVRGLLFEFEHESFKPVLPNKRMLFSGKVIDKWVKRDHEFVKYEVTCTGDDGEVLFRTRRTHVLDYLPRTAPKVGTGIDYGHFKEG